MWFRSEQQSANCLRIPVPRVASRALFQAASVQRAAPAGPAPLADSQSRAGPCRHGEKSLYQQLLRPWKPLSARGEHPLQGTNSRMRTVSNGFQCSWAHFLVRFPCSGERHCKHCFHQPKAHYVVLPSVDVRNADRQWLKLASEVVRKVGWLLRYR